MSDEIIPKTSVEGSSSAPSPASSSLPSSQGSFAIGTAASAAVTLFIMAMLWTGKIPWNEWKEAVGGMILPWLPMPTLGDALLQLVKKLPGFGGKS